MGVASIPHVTRGPRTTHALLAGVANPTGYRRGPRPCTGPGAPGTPGSEGGEPVDDDDASEHSQHSGHNRRIVVHQPVFEQPEPPTRLRPPAAR